MKKLQWWLFVCSLMFGVFLSHHFDWLTPIYSNDETYITYFITALFITTTISIGYKSIVSKNRRDDYSREWFVSDAALTLGMLGTIIGFMIMLYGTFGNLDVVSQDTIKQILGSMTSGLYTALNTTLVGLIASVAIKTQLIIFNHEET